MIPKITIIPNEKFSLVRFTPTGENGGRAAWGSEEFWKMIDCLVRAHGLDRNQVIEQLKGGATMRTPAYDYTLMRKA